MPFKRVLSNICIFAALFLVLTSLSYSQTFYTDFFITVKDINSGEIITSIPVIMNWYKVDKGTTINLTKYLDKRGTVTYRISPGEWKLQIYADNLSTPELDYLGENTYIITEDLVTRGEILYVSPIGSIEIVVSDNAGKLVAGADVDVKCKSFRETAKTDRFGNYKADGLPTGDCKVSAAYNDLVGSSSIIVVQGGVNTAPVTLSKSIKTSWAAYIYYIIGGLLVLIVASGLYLLLRRRMKKQIKEEIIKGVKKSITRKEQKAAPKSAKGPEHKEVREKSEEKKEGLNPRARDIMKTLNDKEQKIVNFLVQSNGKSTQAGIRNETGIPKTTLARLFMSLEAKKVIRVETIGKLKKVEITDWFLGKD